MASEPPFFSVIIPTRNRPVWFQRALQSALDQTFMNREILIVVDGSTDACLEKYRESEALYPGVQFHYLVHRPAGHGQSYSMNAGAMNTFGGYLCFLDDDDFWTDETYLQKAYENIQASAQPVDVHYSNQRALYSDNVVQTQSVWLEDLVPQLDPGWRNCNNSYFVDTDFLLRSAGFAHLNCSIFSREFYESINGMDESIRYENDRDVFIRAVDTAAVMLYNTDYVSQHNIPDVSKKENMSTVGSDIEKKLYQMRVYDKGICFCNHPAVVRFCRRGKTYEQKHAARILARKGCFSDAFYYAREALLTGFNLRWLGYTLYLGFMNLTRPDQQN